MKLRTVVYFWYWNLTMQKVWDQCVGEKFHGIKIYGVVYGKRESSANRKRETEKNFPFRIEKIPIKTKRVCLQ